MQIESRYQIEKAVGSEEPKCYISVEDNRAAACNGRIVAVVPCVVGAGDTPGPVTADSIVHARGVTLGKGCTNLYLKDAQCVVSEDSTEMPRSVKSHTIEKGTAQMELLRVAPTEDETIQQGTMVEIVPPARTDDIVIQFDMGLLVALTKAIGSKDAIRLRIPRQDDLDEKCSVIRVEPVASESNQAYGAIALLQQQD